MLGKLGLYILAILFVSPVFIGGLWLKSYLITASGGTLSTKEGDLPIYFMLGAMLLGTFAGMTTQAVRTELRKRRDQTD